MSDADLLVHFSEMLNVTRPDRQTAVVAKQRTTKEQPMNEKYLKGLEIAKGLGLDVQALPLQFKRGGGK